MCIGVQYVSCSQVAQLLTNNCSLAMAEMTMPVASVYLKHSRVATDGFNKISPGITSRYEVLTDGSCSNIRVRSSLLFTIL